MKKLTLTFVFIALSLLIPCFLYVDCQLYYYGRNDLKLYHSLPFNITPVFLNDFEGGFYLADENGLSIISKGENNWTSGEHLKISQITGYGFSDDEIVVQVTDSINSSKYVEIRPALLSDQNFSVRIINTRPLASGNSKFIELDADYFRTIYVVRNYIELVIISLIFFLIYILLKRRRLNKNNK
jgi:hypothetical protein